MRRVAPTVALNPVTEGTLQHLVRDPSTSQGKAVSGRIVLAAAEGQANQQIASVLGIPQITAGKWRFAPPAPILGIHFVLFSRGGGSSSSTSSGCQSAGTRLG